MDCLIFTYGDVAFQTAFRTYFTELGYCVTNWEGLFAEMDDAAEPTYIRRDGEGRVIAFIMFASMDMKSWFLKPRWGLSGNSGWHQSTAVRGLAVRC